MSTRRIPLGTLSSGPLAEIDDRGTLWIGGPDLADPADAWSLRWWVGGPERWHLTDTEASTRQAALHDTPVIETTVSLAGSEVVGVTAATVGPDAEGAVVTVEVTDRTSVPVAVALVISGARSVAFEGDGPATVTVDGDTIRLDRRAARFATAPTRDALAEVLAAGGGDESWSVPAPGAWVALVVPVPHTQSVGVAIGVGGAAVAPDSVAPWSAVATGWRTHADRGVRVQTPDASVDRSLALHRCLASMERLDGSSSTEALAAQLRLAARLGWVDRVGDLVDGLVVRQHRKGSFPGRDPLAVTLDALDGLVGVWRCGVPAAALEHLVGVLAAALHWVDRQIGSAGLAEQVQAAGAAATLAALMDELDQPGVAADARRWASSWAGEVVVSAPLVAWVPPAPSDDELGVVVAPDGRADLVGAARLVATWVDGLLAEFPGPAAVAVLAGWRPEWAGSPIEVHDVPTRWGAASFALRWHGDRPALLWEVTPWDDGRDVGTPAWCAPVLDPSWVGSGERGEALLAPVRVEGDASSGVGDVAPGEGVSFG